ncbi:MAG: TIGR01212 family radical SAM protein [Desulfovibrio sp.]|uniref:TIGR01212 family radical SAM protein n=1 Tax=Desulfovibrio sp. TaxID=885 RepID=UPI00258B3E2B|nr:TIGR01212 family radical SAM protein [Desulfovibrio sp.]MCD7985149.1 TIGR01212 family radical SAM protein [Desulfovibrio sp.]
MARWHTLAAYFRRNYGTRVQKIPLDAGSACPNRDGLLSTQGCVFCNALGSGSGLGAHGLSLAEQWRAWRRRYDATDPDCRFLAYLQSFSNTYGSLERLQTLLREAAALPGCRGLAVGTRPDCLSPEKLDVLALAGRGTGLAEIWLELGLQSAHDPTLARINRGHTAACSEKAVTEAAGRGLLVCGHLMAGLPGEGEADFLASVDWAASLPLHGLKLHNVYVPEGTELARQYRAGNYLPLERDEYVDLLCAALPRIPSRLVMHRLQSDPAPGELVAPAWAARKRPLLGDLLRALDARDLWQGCRADAPGERPGWYDG